MTETFVKERTHNLTGKVEPVGIDDASAFLCRFANGSLATFESMRYARPCPTRSRSTASRRPRSGTCTTSIAQVLRPARTKVAVRYGWRSVHITDGDHLYMKHWWVPGLQIGYEHTFIHQFADFVEAIAGGTSFGPTRVPRRPADRSRHGRRPQVGGVAAVGNGRLQLETNTWMVKEWSPRGVRARRGRCRFRTPR